MYIIDAKNISKGFMDNGKYVQALDKVSLKIEQGEIFGILGPNGAGKTTMVHILSTLLIPDSGSAKVLGQDLLKESDDIRKDIGTCYGGASFPYNFTPRQILEFYGLLNGVPKKIRRERMNYLIEVLGISEFQNKKFVMLSTGMKQKIAIAKSLINDPKLLFLDEPTVGLDVEIAAEIRKFLVKWAKDNKRTILLTSHYMNEIETMCDRIAIINHGKLVIKGKINQIKKSVNFPDTIWIDLNKRINTEFLKKVKWISNIRWTDKSLEIEVDSALKRFDTVKRLIKKRAKILDLEVRKADLEKVIINIVKKEESGDKLA